MKSNFELWQQTLKDTLTSADIDTPIKILSLHGLSYKDFLDYKLKYNKAFKEKFDVAVSEAMKVHHKHFKEIINVLLNEIKMESNNMSLLQKTFSEAKFFQVFKKRNAATKAAECLKRYKHLTGILTKIINIKP